MAGPTNPPVGRSIPGAGGGVGGAYKPVIRPVHASTPHQTTTTTTKNTPSWLNSAALTPAQMEAEALKEAQDSIAPQVSGLQGQQATYDAQQKAYQAAMTGFYSALAPYMAGIQGHVSDAYNSAAQTMGDIGHGYAGVLGTAAASDNAETNAALARAGQAPIAAPGSGLTDAFAATHGGIDGSSFAQQGAAKAADAANQPAIWAASGRDSLTEAIQKAVAGDADYANQIKQVYATVPALRNTILSQIQSAEIDKQKLANEEKNTAFDQTYKTNAQKIEIQKLADAERNTKFDQGYKVQSFNATQAYRQAQIDFKQQGLAIQQAKLKEQVAAGYKPNAALSKIYGHVVDQYGNTITDSKGKPIPVKSTSGAKSLSPDKINKLTADAAKIASNALNGFKDPKTGKSYPPLKFGQALSEMRKGTGDGSIPLPIALKEMKQAGWKIPAKYAKIMGGASGQGNPFDSSPGMQGPGMGDRSNPIVQAASSMLGTPYVWGGTTPGQGLDCSGFLQNVYAQMGIKIARTTFAQVKQGQAVPLSQLRAGDAIFTEPGKNGPNHVGLYIGNGMVQESPHTGDVNKIIPLKDFLSGGFVAARRYTGG